MKKFNGTILVGACFLVLIFTITESKLTLDIIKRQGTFCGNPSDTSTPLGRCSQAYQNEDFDTFCDDDCVDVFEDYAECLGVDIDDTNIDEQREKCGTAGVGAALLSIISALAVALAATLS